MGQKVKPTGFRLGITEDWRSRWYAGNDYAATLENDLKLRKYVEKKLSNAALSRVEIERAGDKIKVIITTARPGIVIGKKGAEVDVLRKELEKISGGHVSVEVIEVKRPELDRQPHRAVHSPSSSRDASRSAVPCARPSSPRASRVPRVSVFSAPVAWVVPR